LRQLHLLAQLPILCFEDPHPLVLAHASMLRLHRKSV
jgi:hypothetical protein